MKALLLLVSLSFFSFYAQAGCEEAIGSPSAHFSEDPASSEVGTETRRVTRGGMTFFEEVAGPHFEESGDASTEDSGDAFGDFSDGSETDNLDAFNGL